MANGNDNADLTMDKITKLEDELNVLQNSVSGKSKNLEIAKVADDLNSTTKPEMFRIIQGLYGFSKKVLTMLKVQETNSPDSDHGLPSLVRKELKDLLPGLLREALSGDAAGKKTEEAPKESHTIVLEKIGEGEDEEKLSEGEWTKIVKLDVKNALKNVPVLRTKTVEGTARISFKTKEDMDSARDALSTKYKVTPKTQEWKKLDPKLTLSDLDADITDKEVLEAKILEKNDGIRALQEAGETFKVVFLDEKDRLAVVQVSAKIRQCIRESYDRICVDLQQHRVRDRFHIVQCFHCQSFGHMSGSPYCKQKETDPICFYCASSHASKDCKRKKDKKTDSIKCHNCSNSRNSREKDNCKTHNATDYLCPFYIREKERLMSRTHGSEELKNDYLKKVKALQEKYGKN